MNRICVVGAAIAGLLVIGVNTALASTANPAVLAAAVAKKGKSTPSTTTTLTCELKLVAQIPDGAVSVTQGAAQGTQFGRAACGGPLRFGVQSDSFDQDASGSQTGVYQDYFNSGTIYGRYTMALDANGQPPTTTSFTSASYTGTVTIKNGTGQYRNATGSGALKCSTTDAAHLACTEKLRLSLPHST